MKKILFSLSAILLLCFSVSAQEYDYCAGAGGAAACSNNTSTDYVGQKAVAIADDTVANNDIMYCQAFQASMTCDTGAFAYPYINHHETSSVNVKVVLYVNSHGSDTAPNDATNNTLISSGTITTSTDAESATQTNSTAMTGTATKNAWYYVCFVSAGGFRYHFNAAGNTYATGISGSYANPPSTLPTGFETNSAKHINVYVGIGD
jgi:hypothetical protein